MLTSRAIIKQLEAVHLAFQVGAIDRLYPDLGPEERPEAVARERIRDAKYLINLRERIRSGVKKIRAERGLTNDQKETKIALLTATEMRYLRMHINAATWRLQSEADMSKLKGQGELGAFWKLGENVKRHTEDCLRMGGKWWPWPVLEKINPANRHTGCECRLISKRRAEELGFPIKVGRRTATVTSLHELGPEARALAEAYIRRGEELREARRQEQVVEPTPDPAPAPVSRETRPPREDHSERNQRICEMWAEEEMSQSAIGREVGLSQPRVRAILIARFGEEALRRRGKAGARHDLAAAA